MITELSVNGIIGYYLSASTKSFFERDTAKGLPVADLRFYIHSFMRIIFLPHKRIEKTTLIDSYYKC
ncbi:hypothetical protein C9J12_26420 [Photobacterium frigidiphilum]|uniref:Uncharacterized protein n=1 Tax=Photobacterium frigidiphilum TaxID=264736 RepID=A0A2T3J784_9GAMM|nr:hypothetical protein C9J12_26420 [Photobacterium frigidiphilum]